MWHHVHPDYSEASWAAAVLIAVGPLYVMMVVQCGVKTVVEAEGRVDVVVNNAGFNVTGILEVIDPEVSRQAAVQEGREGERGRGR